MSGNNWQYRGNIMAILSVFLPVNVSLRERNHDPVFMEFFPDAESNITLDILDLEHVVAPEEDLEYHRTVTKVDDSYDRFDLRLIVDNFSMLGNTLI